MTLSKNSSLSSEVFQSTQHSFRRNFCSGVSSFGTILAQTFFISKCSIKNVWMDNFPKPSSICYHFNSQSAVTEHERMDMINVFITIWGGGASWPCIILGVFTAFPKTAGPTWKQFVPLGHILHKPVATFDEFRGHSCPVSQETWC